MKFIPYSITSEWKSVESWNFFSAHSQVKQQNMQLPWLLNKANWIPLNRMQSKHGCNLATWRACERSLRTSFERGNGRRCSADSTWSCCERRLWTHAPLPASRSRGTGSHTAATGWYSPNPADQSQVCIGSPHMPLSVLTHSPTAIKHLCTAQNSLGFALTIFLSKWQLYVFVYRFRYFSWRSFVIVHRRHSINRPSDVCGVGTNGNWTIDLLRAS